MMKLTQRREHRHRPVASKLLIWIFLLTIGAFSLTPLYSHETGKVDSSKPASIDSKTGHPAHVVKVWLTTHKERTFRVTQLPRCEHLEAVITHEPSGETLQQAKERMGGVAAITGSFHHPRSYSLADFLQKDGTIYAHATTGRWFVRFTEDGPIDISGDYMKIKWKDGVSAMALGQRLVPLHQDGFSLRFMNQQTDRMAIGINEHYIYIVQGKSDIWRLADFMSTQLPVKVAINSDGGHVVHGKAPVHIVFRWISDPNQPVKHQKSPAISPAIQAAAASEQPES